MRRKASMEQRGNKLWHGSRFVLPEHREAMRVYETQEMQNRRPVLDANKLEELSWVLAEAIQEGRAVTVTLYHPYGNETVILFPQQIDPVQRMLKGTGKDRETVLRLRMADILDITLT